MYYFHFTSVSSSVHENDQDKLAQSAVLSCLRRGCVGIARGCAHVTKGWNALVNDSGDGHRGGRHDGFCFNDTNAENARDDPAYIARQLALDLGNDKEVGPLEQLLGALRNAGHGGVSLELDEGRLCQIVVWKLDGLFVLASKDAECTFLSKGG